MGVLVRNLSISISLTKTNFDRIVAIVVGFGGTLLFFFVPETFWDRTPRAKHTHHRHNDSTSRLSKLFGHQPVTPIVSKKTEIRASGAHVAFADVAPQKDGNEELATDLPGNGSIEASASSSSHEKVSDASVEAESHNKTTITTPSTPSTPPSYFDGTSQPKTFTDHHRYGPPKTYRESLKPYVGQLCHDKWLRVAFRPFILFAYPAVLWSAVVYSLSVGWLIVLSESMSNIYKNRATYNFNSLQTGLVYLSPFIGGILGTAVAGKVSDLIVRFMSRRNDGIYEPEFRLVMGIPIAICTTIGLMGFGWSVQERDHWIVPTVFFGIISFGCSLGSTTSITFVVDSYRQYAGEALVTLNFSKNVLHGFVFSLFFTKWLEKDGPKTVFVAIGAVQMGCLLFTVPLYIYGKRARMWTVRRNLMERF
jgi:hypothetical protein